MKKLIVVDSPLKAKTVWSAVTVLDPESWIVLDYPVPPTEFSKRSSGGTNSKAGFEPQLVPANKSRLERILEISKQCSVVYLCFDPTIEGEEASIYLMNELSCNISLEYIKRIRFNFLTKKLIQKNLDKVSPPDYFSSDKSESLRILDRMVQYHVNQVLDRDSVHNSTVGLCGYLVLSKILEKYRDRRSFNSYYPEYKVHFKCENGSFIASDQSLSKAAATNLAEKCMKWLLERHRRPDVSVQDMSIQPPELYDINSLVSDVLVEGSLRISHILDIIVSLYHEGLIVNPFNPPKVPVSYTNDVIDYLKSNNFEVNKSVSGLQGIVPIDLRLDINKIRQSYRYVYQKIWQRTLHAYGTPTVLSKISISFAVSENHDAANDKFSGVYYDVVHSGFKEFFSKLQRDKIPDILRGVVLEKSNPKIPDYHNEFSLTKDLISTTSLSVFDIAKAIDSLKTSGFIRSGTSSLLIPTVRGLIVGDCVLKNIPFLSDVSLINSLRAKMGLVRQESRAALAEFMNDLHDPLEKLDRHKFVSVDSCNKCSSKLDVVFDRDREPYLFCKKTVSNGCGAVYPIQVDLDGSIKIFEPHLISRPCPKCELFNMRRHNGPYGLFVRCDTCKTTQPFE